MVFPRLSPPPRRKRTPPSRHLPPRRQPPTGKTRASRRGVVGASRKSALHSPTRENRTVARCRHGLRRPAPPEIGGANARRTAALRRPALSTHRVVHHAEPCACSRGNSHAHRPDCPRLEIRHRPLGIGPQRRGKTWHPGHKSPLDAGLLGSIHPQRQAFRKYRALHPPKPRQSRPMPTR